MRGLSAFQAAKNFIDQTGMPASYPSYELAW
jgi:hypothetical protein